MADRQMANGAMADRAGLPVGETTAPRWSADGTRWSKNQLWREGVADLLRIATSSRERRGGVLFRTHLRVDKKPDIDAYY
jgi:hypothetical protein